MAAFHIPLELDLRARPGVAAEVGVEVDLPLLASHAGAGPDDPAVARAQRSSSSGD